MRRRLEASFERFARVESELCRRMNRSCEIVSVKRTIRAISCLGACCYVLIIGLAWFCGRQGAFAAAEMLTAGLSGALLCASIKHGALRERPFRTHASIACKSRPFNPYSFPSGHTTHAVSAVLIMAHNFPESAAPLGTLALLVALSRVILGLHYLSDVLAGAGLGIALSHLSITFCASLVHTYT